MGESDFIFSFDGPATYQITVKGRVDDVLLRRISEMNISHNLSQNEPISTLTGELVDQSALSGLLNTLFDYRYPVISVLKI